ASCSRIPLAAASPVIPPPTIRYFVSIVIRASCLSPPALRRGGRAGTRIPPCRPGNRAGAPPSRGRRGPAAPPPARARRSGRARRSTRRSRSPDHRGRAAARARRSSDLLLDVGTQLLSGVVQGLVQGAAGRALALGEHVDRHAVEREANEDGALSLG